MAIIYYTDGESEQLIYVMLLLLIICGYSAEVKNFVFTVRHNVHLPMYKTIILQKPCPTY